MGKTKPIKAENIVSVPKQKPMILAMYKPLPKIGGCATCK